MGTKKDRTGSSSRLLKIIFAKVFRVKGLSKMRKVIVLLLCVSLLFGILTSAEAESDTAALNEGEISAAAFSALAGEGGRGSFDPINPEDVIDSRIIIVNPELKDQELIIMIRVSESEVYCWAMKLTSDNLALSQAALSEDAPLCLVILYLDGKTPYAIGYTEDEKDIFTFDDFMTYAYGIMYHAFDLLNEEAAAQIG